MSAGESLTTGLTAWLEADSLLSEMMVFDAPPVRAGLPYVVVEDPVLQQADAAGLAGRVGTVGVQLFDDGERPLRLRALIAIVEARIEEMPADVGGGWRIAALSLARSRLMRTKDGWRAGSEWSVRMYRANS